MSKPLKTSPPNRLLDAALYYLRELSWSVIPVEPKGKRPLVQWEAYQRERASEDQIRAWWTEHPTANIGIVTGEVSGIVVLDIDGPEGAKSLEQQPELEPTAMSATSRGTHLFLNTRATASYGTSPENSPAWTSGGTAVTSSRRHPFTKAERCTRGAFGRTSSPRRICRAGCGTS
ncbi:MAG: bifunctional DNA primase/polymerase [Candidatus Latescibacteria bacterium]|nr:bifunctional DNA primase/polymerase [Candidatus Latescibacterota bacterium]